MSVKQEALKMQTHVLRVNVQCHCDGCKKKIKKLLQSIEGVYSTQVNVEQGRVTVTGNVDPAKLVKKLEKSGKHAEIWGAPKLASGNFQDMNSFKLAQNDGGKGGGKDKFQKGGGKGQQQQHNMPMKGGNMPKMVMPNKAEQKNAKPKEPEDHFADSDEEFNDDDFDDFDDDLDDEFDEDDEEDEERQQKPKMPPVKVPVVRNGSQQMKNNGGENKGCDGGKGKGKKGGGAIEIPFLKKNPSGKNSEKKNGDSGKNGKDGGGKGKDGKMAKNNSKKEGKEKKKEEKEEGGGAKGGFGALLGFLKRSKSGREISNEDYDCDHDDIIIQPEKKDDNSGKKNGGGGKKDQNNGNKVKGEFNGKHQPLAPPTKANQMGKMGPMAPLGPMGQFPQMGGYGPMNDFAAVQGLPAQPPMNGGFFPGNHLNQNQQQQYMAMLMNQQRQNGNDMYQAMAYARPPPPMSYMPPPQPMGDPFTHIFSDENTGSCRIM